MRTAVLGALAGIALLIAACSDDGPTHRVHFFHPVWTQDGVRIVAACYDELNAPTDIAREVLPIGKFVVRDTLTGQIRYISIPLGTIATRYWVDREGHIILAKDGLSFYDTDGGFLASYIPPRTALNRVCVDFSSTENAFVYAAHADGRLVAGIIRYADVPWQPSEQKLVIDTATSAGVMDIAITTSNSFTVRLDDGNVINYDADGKMLARFALSLPVQFAFPWQGRLQVHHPSIANQDWSSTTIYARDARGLVRMLLGYKDSQGRDSSRVLVEGSITDFDVSRTSAQMIYESGSGDLWLATIDGIPVLRLAPHNVMGSFSPAGKWLASVGRISDNLDTLSFIRMF